MMDNPGCPQSHLAGYCSSQSSCYGAVLPCPFAWQLTATPIVFPHLPLPSLTHNPENLKKPLERIITAKGLNVLCQIARRSVFGLLSLYKKEIIYCMNINMIEYRFPDRVVVERVNDRNHLRAALWLLQRKIASHITVTTIQIDQWSRKI